MNCIPLVLFFNDQGKQDDAKIAEFESHIVAYLKLWLPFVDYKNWQYYKLHCLMCGSLAFMKKFHMLGRASEQGFESKHFEMARLKDTMCRISQNQLRVQKTSERQQAMFVEGLTESLIFLEVTKENGKC